MEKRTLLAFVLSTLILLIWYSIFPPPQPEQAQPAEPTIESEASPEQAAPDVTAAAAAEVAPDQMEAQAEAIEPPVLDDLVGSEIKRHRIESRNAVFVLSNEGAAIDSALLLGFADDEGQPLDLVRHLEVDGGTRPGQLLFEETPDDRLWSIEKAEHDEVVFRYRAEGVDLIKRYAMDDTGFGLEMEIEVAGISGAELSLGSGLREVSEEEASSRFIASGSALWITEDELEEKPRNKVKEDMELAESVRWAGVGDSFFLRVFQLEQPARGITIHPVVFEGPDGKEDRALRLDVGLEGGKLAGRLLCLPKEYDLLREINGGIEQALVFPPGFLHPISVLFLKAMQWIQGHVVNWGIAIILLTVGIRLMVFPLTHTAMVSMRKMQKLQPRMKAIQERYKGKKDPESRARMGQETMELYKAEGVNPMGGCFPMLIQMPIFFALFSLVGRAIELRHQDFLWVADLSAPDPYYLLPIGMTAAMWIQQKLTPVTAGNAQQMKMLRMMPLIFGAMSFSFPAGLVLYWMTSNLLAILQQKITYKMLGELPQEIKAKEKKDQPKPGRKTGRRSRRASQG